MTRRKPNLTAGQRVRRWREIRGLTIRQLATASGLHKSSIHRIESGDQDPRAGELESIAGAMKLTMAEFYGGEAAA